jgi:photosystem II stability/assembly factor-like uncharacterized protein
MRQFPLITCSIYLLVAFQQPISGNWARVNGPYGGNIYNIIISGNNILAVSGGVFITENMGLNWTEVGCVQSLSANMVATSGTKIVAGDNNSVRFSSDNGRTWKVIWSIDTVVYTSLSSVAMNDSIIYLAPFYGKSAWGGNYSEIIKSNDNGLNWTKIYPGSGEPVQHWISSITECGPYLMFSTYGAILKTLDYG